MEISKNWLMAAAFAVVGLSGTATASPGVYFGVGLGESRLNETGIDNETGKKIFAGYQLNRFIALEGGYTDFGSFNSSSIGTTAELSGLEATLIASYPIGRFTVFGKLGMWDWDYDVETANGAALKSDSGHNIVHGAGVDFRVSNRFKIRTSWDEYRVDDGIASLINLNIMYTF